MPFETALSKSSKPKVERTLSSRHRHNHSTDEVTVGRYDSDSEVQLPPGVKSKLQILFRGIEKEFELLYVDNLALQDRVDLLTERLEAASSGKISSESHDTPDMGSNKAKRSTSQISQKIKTYKANTTKFVSSLRNTSSMYSVVRKFEGHRDGVWEVSVSRTDPQVIGTASADHSARIWCCQTSGCLLQYQGHQGSVNSVRFHPAQEVVLTASGDHTAHIWGAHVTRPSVEKSQSSGEDELDASDREEASEDNLESTPADSVLRTPTMEFKGHASVVAAADWMTDGSNVITASWDRSAILHDTETGESIITLTGHDQELTEVRSHTTQKLLVTSSKDMTFRLWDLRDPNLQVNVFQGHTQAVTSAVFAVGERVVSGSDDRTVKVWDLKNMRSPIASIRTDSSVNRLAVSAAHKIIAIPHDNRHIRLYDIHGNRIGGRLPRTNRLGHSKMVCAVAWADGNAYCNLFSCGFDKNVLGWHINSQKD